MTLQQLRYVTKIVEYGSINEAAKRIFISQPSLSNTIKELEDEMGIAIFARSARGIQLTPEGTQFLAYARQVTEQADLLEQRYKGKKQVRQSCSISTQHYAFAVQAFVHLIEESPADEYKFTLRETRTHDIIEDVSTLRSEIGILYLNDFNRKVITRLLREKHLSFHPLFEASPHVFISSQHPLAGRSIISMADMDEYPCLSFEQGEYNSFHFSEEILSTVYRKKNIHVSDRATLFNLLIGLNGYTICTGVLGSDLNGNQIISVPLDTNERMLIGWIDNNRAQPGRAAQRYIDRLKALIADYGFAVIK